MRTSITGSYGREAASEVFDPHRLAFRQSRPSATLVSPSRHGPERHIAFADPPLTANPPTRSPGPVEPVSPAPAMTPAEEARCAQHLTQMLAFEREFGAEWVPRSYLAIRDADARRAAHRADWIARQARNRAGVRQRVREGWRSLVSPLRGSLRGRRHASRASGVGQDPFAGEEPVMDRQREEVVRDEEAAAEEQRRVLGVEDEAEDDSDEVYGGEDISEEQYRDGTMMYEGVLWTRVMPPSQAQATPAALGEVRDEDAAEDETTEQEHGSAQEEGHESRAEPERCDNYEAEPEQ